MRCKMKIDINAPCDIVWQITQNPERRKDWDYRITESKQLSPGPIGKNTICSVTGNLGFTYNLEYKYVLYQHGVRTAIKVVSFNGLPLISGGGGWTYEKHDDCTCTFHMNISLELKKFWGSKVVDQLLFEPAFKWMSRKSINKLKKIAEYEWNESNRKLTSKL